MKMVNKKISKKNILIFSVLLFSGFVFAQNKQSNTTSDAGLKIPEERTRSASEGFASEEFRRGVQSYYKGAYNESIVQFERALSYLPNDNLILEWLGKAYYKTGLEGSALSYWNTVSNNGYGGLLLQNKIEIVRERRVTGDSSDKLMRLSEAGSFDGFFEGNYIFSGPVSVQPNYDGTMWFVSYNTNQLMLLNQNGKIIDRITGPLNGFDRPSDVIRLKDGKILVSESAGDRLSLLTEKGKFIKYIGSKGRKLGNLICPIYVAQDEFERIYVSDYGNRRVDVFDKDGEPLYFFGNKKSDFEGLKGPTGICVFNDMVYVADDQLGCIYEFDRAGNFHRELVEPKTFKKPEALKIWNNSLVICDENKVIAIDTDTGALFEYVRTGNAPSRVTTANPDVNGNLIVTDFTSNEIYVMSKVQELVGGLFVQIDQVDASKFPNVTVELRVENRHRQPLVGLQDENFYLTENKRPVSNLKYLGSASYNTDADVTIIVDRSESAKLYQEEIETAVKEIAQSLAVYGDDGSGTNRTLRVVSAGAIPATEYIGRPDLLGDFSLEALKNKTTTKVPLDLAMRLSANDLIHGEKKRSIIFVSGGDYSSLSFEKYNLAELTAFLGNNSIGFSVIQVNQNGMNSEVEYILDNTAGDAYYIYRPEGISSIIKDIIEYPQGIYQLSYTSSLQTNFGQAYLPLEAEVYLLNRSGRDESGYFAPLE